MVGGHCLESIVTDKVRFVDVIQGFYILSLFSKDIRSMADKFVIRNSTAEFLTFVAAGKEDGVQVLYRDETVWATQKAMAQLFDCSTDNIGLHLRNIFDSGELNKEATTEDFSVVQIEGGRQVRRKTLFYNLDAIISVAIESIPSAPPSSASGVHTCSANFHYEDM